MINWIIAFFYLLNSYGILNLEQMLTVNLPLLLICRGLYILTYFLNYYKDNTDELPEREKLFTKKETIYFSLKQALIVLFGLLYLPIALFISFYSLMMSGNYIKKIGEKREIKSIKNLGGLINFLSPFLGIIWYTFIYENYYSIAAISISSLAYLYYGLKTSSLSLSSLIEKYTTRRIEKFPKIIQYLLIFILIALPTSILITTVIYEPQEKLTYMVPMQDGVHLATDVYFSPGSFGAPRPVILIRTPYGKNGMGELYGMLYLTQNYHVVMQDCRGCFDSATEEDFIFFIDAYKDGVDTIEWILDQPWCNGKIASAGASALGINQIFYAGMNPDGLKAQSLMIATPDLYTSIYQGGAFREAMSTEWAKLTAPDDYEYQLQQLIKHTKKDVFYNSTSMDMDIGPSFKNVSVSAIHIGGWFDIFQQGTLDSYMGYDDLGLPSAQSKQLLIMGPFTHGFPTEGTQGELFFPTKSVSASDLYLQWEQNLFDHALLGELFDWSGNRVAYYMMGDVDNDTVDANDYRFAKDWPIDHVDDKWYFTADGGLNSSGAGLTNYNFSYLFDPRNPVPTLGGTNLLIDAGPYDQRSIENRSDVLIFESSAFTEPYEVVGHMWAHIYVTSNCTNTDFTVKITDVYPDGRSILISDGIINAVRRNGFNDTAPNLNSTEYVEVDIDLWSIAYQFNVGHKIRVAVSSSNYPRFAINPNSGAPQAIYSHQYLERYIANNTILVGSQYPSHIILPRPI